MNQFAWLVAQFHDRSDLEGFAARLLHIPLPAQTPLITRDASSCSLYLVARGALSITVTHAGGMDSPAARPAVAPDAAPAHRHAGASSGRQAVVVRDGGGTLTLGHIREGGWIGENGLLNLEPLGYTVTVARDSWLLVLTASQFARLRRERPGAASTLLQVFSLQLVDRFRAYRRRVAEQAVRAPRDASANASLALLAVLLGITTTA